MLDQNLNFIFYKSFILLGIKHIYKLDTLESNHSNNNNYKGNKFP